MYYLKLFFYQYKTTHIILLALVLTLGIAVRFIGLNNQFTHTDDIGVAWSILIQTNDVYTINYVRNKINNISHEDYNTPQYKLLREFDESSKLEALLPYIKDIVKFIVVPQAWTYAPFQFFFTSFLISFDHDYQSLLFWGRFPSFIFSSLALILMAYIFMKIDIKNAFLLCVSGLLFLGFSWENIIYAKHMSNYAVGVLGIILLFYAFIRCLNDEKSTVSFGILIGILLAIVSNMQYTIIYFMPAFFLSWLWYISEKKVNWLSIKPFFFAVISYFIFMLPTFIVFILPQAYLNGQTFIGTLYNYNVPADVGIYGIIKYSVIFFVQNGFNVIKFITAYLPYDNDSLNIITLMIIFLALFGLIRMLFYSNIIYKNIGRFFIASALTIILLIIMKKVSFSPTRHSLIYLPYFVFLVAYGISEINNFIQRKFKFNIKLITALVLVSIVLLPFFSNYSEVFAGKKDPFSEKMISNLIERYKPHYVIASDMNLFFMNPFKKWDKHNGGERIYNIFINPEKDGDKTYMLISQLGLNNEICGKMISEADGRQFNCENNEYKIIYEYDFNSNSTLDILREAHIIYNRLSIKIIKF